MTTIENIANLINLIVTNDEIDSSPRPKYENWVIGFHAGSDPVKNKSRGYYWKANVDEAEAVAELFKGRMVAVEYVGDRQNVNTFYLYHK